MIGFMWQRQVALVVCDDILLHFFPVHIDGLWFEKVLENREPLGTQFKDPVTDGIIAQRFFVVYQWCFQWVARLHGGVAADDRHAGRLTVEPPGGQFLPQRLCPPAGGVIARCPCF